MRHRSFAAALIALTPVLFVALVDAQAFYPPNTPKFPQARTWVAQKAKLVAAELFECSPEDIVLADGRVLVKGLPDRSLSLGKVARAAVRSRALANTAGPGLSHCAFFYPGTVTWAFGAQGVALDPLNWAPVYTAIMTHLQAVLYKRVSPMQGAADLYNQLKQLLAQGVL